MAVNPTDSTPVGAMPPNIQTGKKDPTSIQLAKDMRTKRYGKDVRETMARMIEWTSVLNNFLTTFYVNTSTQNSEYYRQFTDVLKELSEDKDYHSLPEIAGARGGFGTLGARLVNTDTQLAQTKQAFNDSVSKVTVNSEVILARGGKTTLGARIDEIDNAVDAVRGKNYLEGVSLIDGFYVNDATGEFVEASTNSVTDVINLIEGQKYVLSNTDGGLFTNTRIVFYDELDTYVFGYRIEGGSEIEEVEFTVPYDASKARISVQRSASPDYSTWKIGIKDFKVITTLDLDELQPKLVAGEGLSLDNNELQLDFVEAGDLEEPADGVYEKTNLNDYRNTDQDGYMILEDGRIVTTSATLIYTTTDPIPVSGGEQFSFAYRAIYFSDNNNVTVAYLTNTQFVKSVVDVPAGATKMIVVTRTDMMEGTVIDRLTPRNEDIPIRFTRPIQGIGSGAGGGGEVTEPLKNLMEGIGVTEGKYIHQDTAEILDASTHMLTDPISILPNKTVVLTTETGFNNLRWVQFDEFGNRISGLIVGERGANDVEIPLESNADTIRFSSIFGGLWDSPDKWSLVYKSSEGGGVAYDQQLNTFNDVEFNSVKTNALDVSGTIPTGTLSNPPSGLLSGDMWADTTDSTTHPIVRVML